MYMEMQGTQNVQNDLEKEEKSWRTHTSSFQNLLGINRDTVPWHEGGHTGRCDGTGSAGTRPHPRGRLVPDTGSQTIWGGGEACAQCRRCHHVTGRRRLGSRASSSARCGGQAGWVKERLGVSKPPPLVPFLAFQTNVLGSTKDYAHGHAKYEYKKENDSRTNHPAITITELRVPSSGIPCLSPKRCQPELCVYNSPATIYIFLLKQYIFACF